jgi:glycopeptide antibiotics resistance protein
VLAPLVELLVVLLVTFSPPHVVGEGRRGTAAVLASLVPFTEQWGRTKLELVGNLALFVPLGVLGVLVLGSRRAVWVVVAGAGCSAVIEVVQEWLPGRVSDPVDVLLNSAGTALGATVTAAVVGVSVLVRRA